MDRPGNITTLLRQLRQGDSSAEERLLGLVYEDLRRLAQSCMRGERGGHTLQPTALLHETWMRLIRDSEIDWQNRAHFFALAARAMRRILVEYARRRGSAKRGGIRARVELTDGLVVSEDQIERILVVEEALDELQGLDARQARIVEMRFFGGLTEDEVAAVLGLTTRAVKRDWQMARAWLGTRLGADGASGPPDV
ncbi:MAG: sigma-70 family RNA polymerase sigma factor [Acidobacteria bacterium]|nr:sigma-70 family RNA polymerase sigma factor [Acidobacteriota bacterium]